MDKVATQAVAKAIPLEKFATGTATSVIRATSPAIVAIAVSTMVATVILTAVLSRDRGKFFHNALFMSFLSKAASTLAANYTINFLEFALVEVETACIDD